MREDEHDVETRFNSSDVVTFRYVHIAIDYNDAQSITVLFEYSLDGVGGRQIVACTESYQFPAPANGLSPARREAFERLAEHLGLAAGLSYYKLAAPPNVEIADTYSVDGFTVDEIGFHRRLLARGLGEFSFVNGLDAELSPRYGFRCVAPKSPVTGLDPDAGPLLPVGGGKDSCVSIEALRDAAGSDPTFSPTLITVNRYPVIADVIRDSNLPDLAVQRKLDEKLGVLNAQGALNGHVPATAIVSLAVLCAAALHGHAEVVMSNERSASEGNVTYRGVEINHQWSKSEESERAISELVASVAPELTYFSLLRPLSELSIARRFAATCQRYFASFSSCNAAFRLDPARRTSRWCGQCPKCQFVYLALATTLERDVLEGIWGSELFASSPEEGFCALLGLREWKPFECVGEIGECRVALRMVADNPAWAGHPVLERLKAQLMSAGGWPSDADSEAVFSPQGSLVPDAFAGVIASLVGTP